MARGRERHGGVRARCRASARSSCSATTCARRCGSRRSCRRKVVFVWTHDSVGVGEDGPTHQPIEQLASLRAMPGLRRDPAGRRQRGRGRVARAPRRRRPDRHRAHPPEGAGARRHRRARGRRCARAARTCSSTKTRDAPDVVLDRHRLRGVGVRRGARAARGARASSARVVSMPSWDLFEAQPDDYRVDVLPPDRADARGRGRRRASAGSATPTTS